MTSEHQETPNERRMRAVAMRIDGHTLGEIGTALDVTSARALQIIHKAAWILVSGMTGGVAIKHELFASWNNLSKDARLQRELKER